MELRRVFVIHREVRLDDACGKELVVARAQRYSSIVWCFRNVAYHCGFRSQGTGDLMHRSCRELNIEPGNIRGDRW